MKTPEKVQRLTKADKIPKVDSWQRALLLKVIDSLPGYKAAKDKGLRLLNRSVLDKIEERYPAGMTWKDVERELNFHGIELSKPTFRKHVQNFIVPKATSYKIENGKRMAVFPAETISHINLNRFFLKFANREFIENLLDAMNDLPVFTCYEVAESRMKSSSLFDDLGDQLSYEIFMGHDDAATSAINEVLGKRPEDNENIKGKIKMLAAKAIEIQKDISSLISYLKNEKISTKDFGIIKERGEEA